MSQFNQKMYNEALTEAEKRAVAQKEAYVVRYWSEIDEFMPISLENATIVGGWDVSTIAATVNHEGIITESRWVKPQMGGGVRTQSVSYDVQIWIIHPNGLEWMDRWAHIAGFQDKQTAIDFMNLLPIESKRRKRIVESTFTETAVEVQP